MPSLLTSFIPTPHILLKLVKCTRLLLALSIRLRPFVKFPVYELSCIQNITQCLLTIVVKTNLVSHIRLKHLLSQLILKLIYLEAFQVIFGCFLLKFIVDGIWFINHCFHLCSQILSLIYFVQILDLIKFIWVSTVDSTHLRHINLNLTIWVQQLSINIPKQIMGCKQRILTNFLVIYSLVLKVNLLAFLLPIIWVHQTNSAF